MINESQYRHIGRITQVIGPVVDVRFNEGELPKLQMR